jgi:RNA-directed DNA polymerase
VDSSMLALIKMFLVAPVIDERDGGTPRRPKAGTPQGGVVSPLLANVYLHLLDRNYRRRVERGELEGRLIRYCDDFVLLTRQHPARELSWLQTMMARMGLSLHPDKTRVVNARKERFDFLGYRVGWRRQQLLLDVSPKSCARIRERLRQPTTWTFLPVDELVAKLNRYIRGARAYFRLAPWWSLRTLDGFMSRRMAMWWRRKLGMKYPAWSRVSERKLHTEHGLLSWAGTPSWDKQATCARR